MKFVPIALIILFRGSSALAQEQPTQGFSIGGAVAHPTFWISAFLRSDKSNTVQTITYTLKGVQHHAHAISLLALVQFAEPKYHSQIKNHLLQFMLAAQGRDGYTVDFSMAEILPQCGNRAVWVALDEDDKPLAADIGPLQLIVPDDAKPGRWVHALAKVTVADGEQMSASIKP